VIFGTIAGYIRGVVFMLLSGKEFTGRLEPGRAALLVSDKGELLASYNW
jgi:hypothetical protein